MSEVRLPRFARGKNLAQLDWDRNQPPKGLSALRISSNNCRNLSRMVTGDHIRVRAPGSP
jgi:hypothetical protein